jgi:hypothetical protein
MQMNVLERPRPTKAGFHATTIAADFKVPRMDLICPNLQDLPPIMLINANRSAAR